jgi:hypothetical protein
LTATAGWPFLTSGELVTLTSRILPEPWLAVDATAPGDPPIKVSTLSVAASVRPIFSQAMIPPGGSADRERQSN